MLLKFRPSFFTKIDKGKVNKPANTQIAAAKL